MVAVGVVEGFYGRPYTWSERRALVLFLASEGYDHYIYAPKADRRLRAHWTEEHSAADRQELRTFGEHCQKAGLEWGIGLSPLTDSEGFPPRAEDQLLRLVEQLLAYAIDRLAMLFDDVRSHPRLAETQIAMVQAIRSRFPRLKIIICPTFYSTSPVLDRVFGERPVRYLEELGRGLDRDIEIFWTGPNVCSEIYPDEHLAEVTDALGRPPWIWDNYPVNDGPRMFRFLHLLGFPPRTQKLLDKIAGISVNPMNQPWLSRIPLATLPRSLRGSHPTDREQAFLRSGERLLPASLLRELHQDLHRFNVDGLDRLTPDDTAQRIVAYSRFDHPAAWEVVNWLRGETEVDADCLTG